MDGSFPTGWALMKPQQTIDPAEFNAMWRRGGFEATLKRDGNRAHIVTAGPNTRIYSRNGTLDWTDRLPHIAAHWAKASAGFIVDVELHTEKEGTRSFQDAMNADPDEILWSPFDLLRVDGSMNSATRAERVTLLNALVSLVGYGSHYGGGIFFHLPENATYEEALARIAKAKCEGLVIWDLSAPHIVNTNGNTKRGRSWKIKPKVTEDLVVLSQTPSKDPALGVGTLKVARRDEETGALTAIKAPLGSFDLGFDRRAATGLVAPYVVEVSHFGEDDNGNLVFPKVLRTRPDLHADFGIAQLARAA